MLLISSASNPWLHVVMGFSNSGFFFFLLVLISSQLLCWYHSVSCCLFLLVIPLTILHFFHVLSHHPICYSKIVYYLQHLVFGYWYFLHHLSVNKLFSDFGQIFCWSYTVSFSHHISSALLFLHGVAISALLSLFLFLFSLCYTSFQVTLFFFVPHLSSLVMS